MKTALLAACAGLLLGSGCGSKGTAEKQEQLTIVVEADRTKLAQEEADLQKRVDDFHQERERLRQEQEKLLAERIKSGGPSGQAEQMMGQVKDILEKQRRLWEREKKLEQERQNIDEKKEQLGATPAGGQGSQDQSMARRESRLAERESALAGREKQLAEREAALAKREAEFLATQARLAAMPAPLVAKISGGKPVSAAAAQKAYTGVLGAMRKKGILAGDLPPEGSALLQEMESARKEADHSKLAALADQLQIVVRTTRIDAGFLDRKFQRLAQISSSRAPAENVRAELGKLQRKATTLYSDGKFAQANSELNRMFSLLGER